MTELMLSGRARAALLNLITHTDDARVLRRAYALVWLDDGESVPEVAEQLHVSRQSVYNWLERFVTRRDWPLDLRLRDAERSGRPVTVQGIIDPFVDAIIDTDPRAFGYRSSVWTVPLLVDYLAEQHQVSASPQSVRLALARLDIDWKRPRHRLALHADTWQQAKGG
ncbi:MAG TPA: helix-turn-helix domain-containing protein [Anaerolineae bacterium]|nr:helix-turn-helix domain-containing protein [Anaerolineae bacterium]